MSPGAPARHTVLDAAPPWLLVLTSIASVQFGAAIARTMFPAIGATGTLLLRLGLSAVILAILVRPRVRSWPRRAWWPVLGLGLALGLMNLSFYLALARIPLGVAVTVEFTGPLLLALVQTRRLADGLWAALAMAGVALLGLDTGADLDPVGLLFAFVAGLFWACYIVASARVGRILPGLQGLSMALVIACLIVVPLGLHALPVIAARPELLLGGLVVALMSSIICYGLELIALRRMPTRVFGILMSLEPAAAALGGLVVLGERLALPQLAALVMVSVASVGVTLGARNARNRTPVPLT